MNWMLTIKHWQLFGLLVAPLVVQVIVFSLLEFTSGNQVSPAAFFIGWLGFIVILLWLYALGTGLHKKLPPEAPMKLGYFKATLLYPVVYFFVFACFMVLLFEGVMQPKQSSDQFPMMPFIAAALLVPLHILAMVCMINNVVFASKLLRSVELQKRATVADFLGDCFLFWFFPIGVWVIQPRINKLVANH